MKSIKAMMVFLLAVLVMFACNKVSHKKTPGGMPYQLFRGKGTVKAKKWPDPENSPHTKNQRQRLFRYTW